MDLIQDLAAGSQAGLPEMSRKRTGSLSAENLPPMITINPAHSPTIKLTAQVAPASSARRVPAPGGIVILPSGACKSPGAGGATRRWPWLAQDGGIRFRQ